MKLSGGGAERQDEGLAPFAALGAYTLEIECIYCTLALSMHSHGLHQFASSRPLAPLLACNERLIKLVPIQSSFHAARRSSTSAGTVRIPVWLCSVVILTLKEPMMLALPIEDSCIRARNFSYGIAVKRRDFQRTRLFEKLL